MADPTANGIVAWVLAHWSIQDGLPAPYLARFPLVTPLDLAELALESGTRCRDRPRPAERVADELRAILESLLAPGEPRSLDAAGRLALEPLRRAGLVRFSGDRAHVDPERLRRFAGQVADDVA